MGLPDNISGREFKEIALQAFSKSRKNFHAIHWLWNKKVTIGNLVKWSDVLEMLNDNKKLYVLSLSSQLKLKTKKLYVSELLCPSCKCILGKSNSLLEVKYIKFFWSFDAKRNAIYKANTGYVTSEVSHEVDLVKIFCKEILLNPL